MPLVRISLQAGKSESYRTAISNEVYQEMRQTLDIPDGDRFQVITEHNGGQLVASALHGHEPLSRFRLDPDFPLSWSDDGDQSGTLSQHRGTIGDITGHSGGRRDDRLDRSRFGRLVGGEAQYVLHPPAWATNKETLFA